MIQHSTSGKDTLLLYIFRPLESQIIRLFSLFSGFQTNILSSDHLQQRKSLSEATVFAYAAGTLSTKDEQSLLVLLLHEEYLFLILIFLARFGGPSGEFARAVVVFFS